nr:PRAME family member 12-like [Microcebus murinus]
MSLQAPPRLLQLAGQSLLRDEAVAFRDVKELPRDFFPQLFMEAFTKRQRKVLTAMVQAWPFTCLLLGSLMLTPDLETLRAVLDGLDVLLAQKVRPSGWKLRVLDLRQVGQNFWSFWSVWSAAPVLILEDCLIRDFQLSQILPSLSRCHQLMTFNFCGNQISKAALENLLRHTLGLQRLNSVTYPVPHECYHGDFEHIYWGRFLQLRAWLMEILRDTQALRQPEVILFRTLPCLLWQQGIL